MGITGAREESGQDMIVINVGWNYGLAPPWVGLFRGECPTKRTSVEHIQPCSFGGVPNLVCMQGTLVVSTVYVLVGVVRTRSGTRASTFQHKEKEMARFFVPKGSLVFILVLLFNEIFLYSW